MDRRLPIVHRYAPPRGGADETHCTEMKRGRFSWLRDALIAAATLVVVVVLAACTAAFGWYEQAARPLTIVIGVTSGILMLAALITFYWRHVRTRPQEDAGDAVAAPDAEVS